MGCRHWQLPWGSPFDPYRLITPTHTASFLKLKSQKLENESRKTDSIPELVAKITEKKGPSMGCRHRQLPWGSPFDPYRLDTPTHTASFLESKSQKPKNKSRKTDSIHE
jgi:hypothetical protein